MLWFPQGVSLWNKERRKPDSNHRLERSGSAVGDNALDRRGSMLSLAAMSESSRSDVGIRTGRRGDEGERAGSLQVLNQLKNYFKSVSENKEIAKLVSLLSTSINSTKKVGLHSWRTWAVGVLSFC